MNRIPRWLMAAFAVILLVLLIGGAWFYLYQERRLRAKAEENLQAISHLKIDQITQWRTERLADADEILERPFTNEVIARWITTPDPNGSEQILSSFRSLQRHYHLQDVLLVDTGGRTLLSLSGQNEPLDTMTAHALEDSFRRRRPMICDLHMGHINSSPIVEVVAPLFAGKDRNAAPLGAIIERIDARQFLYPLIASWPTESKSAETMIVRRDGDSVLYLNDLRFRKNSALKLQLPLTSKKDPAVMAVRGSKGMVEGIDYRGVKVLAVLQAVPDSHWFMVTKIDEAEVLADWQYLSSLILALVLGLVTATAAAMGMAWQHYAKAQLRESEDKYRDLYDEAPIGYVELDTEGRIDRVNRRLLELMGYAAEEMLGKPMWSFVLEREASEEVIRAKLSGLTPPSQALERHFKRKSGPPIPVLIKDRVAKDGQGRITRIRSAIQDITDLKQAEEALRRSHDELEVRVRERTAELERKNRELEEFTFIAAHDLSEPLRKIRTFGSILEERGTDCLGERERHYISRMRAVAERMQELLYAILAYSHLEADAQPFRSANLNEIVKDVLTDLEPMICKFGAEVEIGPLPAVAGEPNELRQLFHNLISNSLKYHRPDVKPSVRVHGEKGATDCRIFVEDNGIGFDEKYLEKVFKPFQCLHKRNEYSGTGIGLAICKKIVEHHGGGISARSTPGRGSAFIVTLPARQDDTP